MKMMTLFSMMVLLAATQRPAVRDSRPVILAFGDSLTAGYGVPRGSGYPEQLQRKLDGLGYKYRIVNMGISGDTTSGGRARIQAALNVMPSVVILELGANDGLRGLPVAQMQANLEEMIGQFQRAGAKVVLAGMTLPRNYGGTYVGSFEDVFRNLARKYNLALIPFFLEGVAGNPKYTLDDFLHPNADGYVLVTDMVMKTLGPVLKK
ncbi:MAG TPA: arylesterase [Terriglobia bacterium]|nr:arylesterase [Terriglobia bacterium]